MSGNPRKLLGPYLAGAPSEDGEQDLHCPLHPDARRSATINFDKGVWWCGAGCGGGKISDLVEAQEDWLPPPGGDRTAAATSPKKLPTDKQVKEWSQTLLKDESLHSMLVGRRGITRETMETYEIGWDADQGVFTIPVRDAEGQLKNVRYYDMNPNRTRRKIWQVKGHAEPRLYPISILAEGHDYIIISEGEWDALLTIQNGFPAITKTASAGTWLNSWSPLFKDRVVYICNDCDEPGRKATAKMGHLLAPYAAEVRAITLPYPVTEDHGKDLTDYWLDGHTPDQFQRLMQDALPFDSDKYHPETTDPHDADVLDSFDSDQLGNPLRLTVTIKGKREPGYSVPREASLSCTQNAGEKCTHCPLNGMNGQDTLEIETGDPIVLDMMNSTKNQLHEILRQQYGAVKCNKLTIEIDRWQAVEILFARPSVEHMNGSPAGAYKNMKINSVGRHDTLPNSTVQVVGALHVDPRSQLNEFLAWDLARLETSVDNFEMTPTIARMLKRFRPRKGQRPLKKLGDIAREISSNVTHIYGRLEMHVLMDLVWHSALSFTFDKKLEPRGWLQVLIIGDTGTGKSETALRLAQHYGSGEVVACETATMAGIVGGLQQFGGSSKEWAVTWGALPNNDRRLVVLDEVSGLHTEEIGKMSQIRSSGIAELTKIMSERTYARTRTIWLGNPRNAKMRDFTFGVQALTPLIGTSEDLRRFDAAMSVSAGEVSAEIINQSHDDTKMRYDEESCRALVRWVWSRTPEQVVWAPGAEQAVYHMAKQMGDKYIDEPPLVIPSDIRMKIARFAVAIAARTFSTTDDYQSIYVTRDHVKDAVSFLDILYDMPGFGYGDRSRAAMGDSKEALDHSDEIRSYLDTQPGLAKFLKDNSSFRANDLENVLNVSRDMASAIINTLWTARMVRKDGANIRIEPAFHSILRRIK